MTRIVLNGEPYDIETGCTITELLGKLELNGQIAVEVNHEIVPRSEFTRRRLQQDDTVEIVRAIGGG